MRYTTSEMKQQDQQGPTLRDELREELLATIQARKELSPAEEGYLVQGFLERLDREIDARIDARPTSRRPRGSNLDPGVVVPLFVFAIPITAIAGYFGHAAGIALVWFAMAVIVYLAGK